MMEAGNVKSGHRERRRIDFRYPPDIQQVCIGLIDDPHKTIVREDGSLNYGYIGSSDFTDDDAGGSGGGDVGGAAAGAASAPGVDNPQGAACVPGADSAPAVPAQLADSNAAFLYRLKPRFSHRDQLVRRTQDFGDPRVALVTTTEEFTYTTLRWEVFAWYHEATGLRADVIIWEMTAGEAFGRAPSRVELELSTAAAVHTAAAHPATGEGVPRVWETAGTTAYWSDEGVRLPGLDQYRFLNSGETRAGAFAVVLAGPFDPASFTVARAREAREQMVQYWLSRRVFRKEFRVPDQAVQGMLHACGRNILQAREVRDGVTEFQVGPTLYRGLWTVDAHFILEAAHMMGLQEEAFDQGLLATLRRVKPDGSIQIMPRHDKETAIAIATIIRQCELMADDQRLRELWPTVLRAVGYIRRLREEAEAMGPEYPGQKLFPPALVDGGIKGPFGDYATASWMLFGLKSAAEAGQRLDLPDHQEVRDLFTEVLHGFHQCAHRDTAATPEGNPYLPMIMEVRPFNRPQSATWAFAQAMCPGEVFPPDSPYVTNLLRLLESVDGEEGIPLETGWIHHHGLWSYSAMFYAQVMLYAGRPEKAIDYLYAFANHASPGRVWREEHTLASSRSAEYCGDMPHNWASAEFIRLVRNAIIFEKGDTLELLRGLPPEWLPRDTANREDGSDDLFIEESPTRFGLVTVRLAIDTTAQEGRFRLYFHRRPGVVEPKAITLWWNGVAREDAITPQSWEKEVLL